MTILSVAFGEVAVSRNIVNYIYDSYRLDDIKLVKETSRGNYDSTSGGMDGNARKFMNWLCEKCHVHCNSNIDATTTITENDDVSLRRRWHTSDKHFAICAFKEKNVFLAGIMNFIKTINNNNYYLLQQ